MSVFLPVTPLFLSLSFPFQLFKKCHLGIGAALWVPFFDMFCGGK